MKNMSYPKHTWCHPALVVKKSKINNKGIFTTESIKKGKTVMIFGGEIINRKQTDDPKFREMSIFPIEEDLFLGSTIEEKDEYLNHSCDPNIWLTDAVTVIAKRDIKQGEEITLDCATWDADPKWTYSESGKCTCGSETCRKTLSHDDWMRTDIQEKYKGHFSPYIQKKIDDLSAKG